MNFQLLPVEQLKGQHLFRWTHLRPSPNHPTEKGAQQNVTSYANRVHLPRTGSELNRQVVRNVPARGVTEDESTVKVNAPGHPLIPAVVALSLEPPQGFHAVIHCGGKAVLWSEAVVRGHHGGMEARS